jgi:hypothetical protein
VLTLILVILLVLALMGALSISELLWVLVGVLLVLLVAQRL